jgi:hypothetical protein
VEPFEFTSNGGGGEALPRRVKMREMTFYEVINVSGNIARARHAVFLY